MSAKDAKDAKKSNGTVCGKASKGLDLLCVLCVLRGQKVFGCGCRLVTLPHPAISGQLCIAAEGLSESRSRRRGERVYPFGLI
ncbi:MAG: hypothetical protein IPK27_18910 [Rhodanobacteraceae bacterium]|nr:hypothetical protein [Rhodanobacteraceae bacterium]